MKFPSRIMLAALLVLIGVNHFTHGDEFARIVPPIFSYPLQLVWITGVLEFLFAVGLLQSRRLPLIGRLLSLYLLVVLSANIYQAAEHINIFTQYVTMPSWAAWLRVALQFPLIAWVLWATAAVHPERVASAI